MPLLAASVPTLENGGISRDGLTITYRLRSGVRWHDGVAFTSRDVAFSWRAMMNPANNVNARVGYDVVRSVDTPDPLTVVFHLKRLFAPFVNTVFAESDDPICIVPEHVLGQLHDVNQAAFNSAPVGTGAFKVVRWVRGDHIELTANDAYFRGKPKLRRIVLREIPDENTEVNALRSHDVDWMFEASPQLYRTVSAIPGLRVLLVDQPQTLGLYLNTSHSPLDDVRVRRAIAYAVDKAAIVAKNTGGSARVAWADQPAYSWAYEPAVATYPPSPDRARTLLRQAGWVPGPDGLARKGGRVLSLQLAHNVENATRRLVAVQVQAMLKAAGIDAQIKTYPANLFFATYGQGGIMTTGRFDIALAGWIAGYDPDDHSLYACDQMPPRGVNYTRYCSREMDAAQREALGTNDEAVRKRAYSRIQRLLARDVPEDYVWVSRQVQPTDPAFSGFAPNPVNEAWNAYQWAI